MHPGEIDDYKARVHNGHLAKPTVCQVCHGAGPLHWHSVYRRDLITLTDTVVIPVKRLFCASCRRTFALLPAFVVKFHRYARDFIRDALRRLKRHPLETVADQLMESTHRYVATLTLHLWRKTFVSL